MRSILAGILVSACIGTAQGAVLSFAELTSPQVTALDGLMRVLRGWGEGSARPAPDLAAAERYCVHACLDETSVILALRPDRVGAGYRDAPPLVGDDIAGLRALAEAPGWPGYFGTPRHARPEFGRAVLDALAREMVAAANDLLDGQDERLGARFGDVAGADPREQAIDAAPLAFDARLAARQRAWLEQRKAMSAAPAP